MQLRATALLAAFHVLAPAAEAQQPAAPPPRNGGAPAVSPDGKWIAFISDRTGGNEVYLIGPDGSGERRLTLSGGGKGRLSWIDSARLAFSGSAGDTSRLYSLSLDGSEPRLLGSVPGRAATLSPDGRRVLYASGPYSASRLIVSGLDGVDPRFLTGGTPAVWSGRWSPEGARIAFEQPDTSGSLNVWVMNTDGGQARQVTHLAPAEGRAQLPAWSPEGSRLAFQVSSGGAHLACIWILDLASGRTTQLGAHTESYVDELPAWFPDGRHIAFQSDRSGRMEIWVMSVDGTEVRQITR